MQHCDWSSDVCSSDLERYTLVGSYNLLSYDGGEKEMFQGYHFRFEGGVMIDDAEFAKHVIKEIGM